MISSGGGARWKSAARQSVNVVPPLATGTTIETESSLMRHGGGLKSKLQGGHGDAELPFVAQARVPPRYKRVRRNGDGGRGAAELVCQSVRQAKEIYMKARVLWSRPEHFLSLN